MSVQPAAQDIDNTLIDESKSNDCPIDIDKNLLQDIIGSTRQTDSSTESSRELKDDQNTTEKTNEADTAEQTNSKTSRELKQLLALSKEANLDTNISHKRKTLDGSRGKKYLPKSTSMNSDVKKEAKPVHEHRNIKYPVTAESELEVDVRENEVKGTIDNTNNTSKRKRDSLSEVNIGGATEELVKKARKSLSSEVIMFKPYKDMFCWRCHKTGVNIACETCPRSYHQKCLKQTIVNTNHWPCPECVTILKAESTQTRSEAMRGMTLEHLCSLLKFAVNRMMQFQGSEPFLHPVNNVEFPDYEKYIIQPMDLTKIEKNIKENLYGSTQAFEADAKWLLHNSIIFNSYQSKLTTSAKNIVKVCKQEMTEIENCPSCYLNANTKKGTWFVEVCPKPHLLVWAKLRGFPYWPAKVMCSNSAGMVDVRFFGAHDRAWVHHKECYLFSEKDPNTFKQKRYDIEKCIQELNIYIENLEKVYGEFRYAPFKTLLELNSEIKQLQILLPKYKQHMSGKKKIQNKGDSVENKTDSPNYKKETQKLESSKEDKVKDNSETKDDKTENINGKTDQVKERLEIKENIPESKENQTGLESKTSLLDTENYSRTKVLDDSCMDGYGTDDDSNSEIDFERRKTFIEKNAIEQEDGIEEDEEDDNDTQVPCNISVESNFVRNSVRTRGGHTNFSGRLKILPRRNSELENGPKRQSVEDVVHSPTKISRRNSDQSVKSDSSRISNISDKINRVDISENMEITLGNDDIGCVSISENRSPTNSESSKSSNEHNLENKKKPVQVEIENTELTISPSNKLKIADKLMKRLSDSDENTVSASKLEEAKRAIVVEKKSPTDILIEKFKNVVEHKIVDFGQPSISSSTEDENTNSNLDCGEHVTSNPEDISNNNNEIKTKESATVNNIAPEETGISNKNSEKIENNKGDINENVEDENNTMEKAVIDKLVEGNNQHIECNLEKDVVVEQAQNSRSCSPDSNKTCEVENKAESIKKQPDNQNTSIQLSTTDSTLQKDQKENTSPMENKGQELSEKKHVDPKPVSIEEEIEDSEITTCIENVEIDKNKILNIIHSSLKETKISSEKAVPVEDTSTSEKTITTGQKRKFSSDESTNSRGKFVKIVPIENVLKNHNNTEDTEQPSVIKIIQGKKIIPCKPQSNCPSPASSESRHSSLQEIIPEDIKSEPESDDDSEAENLEEKRKYLSALNISEKVTDSDRKLKANEIRTRSKTEEKKEKFKVIDNLTRIIDDVALNYSANHEGEKLPPKKPERRKSIASSQEGEIFVKSFAKMQVPKQRARKSFPIPPYVKFKSDVGLKKFSGLITPPKTVNTNVSVNGTACPKISTTTSLASYTPNSIPAVQITPPTSHYSKSVTSTLPMKTVATPTYSKTVTTTKPLETVNSSLSHVILLPTSQAINYNSPLINPILNVVSPMVSATTSSSLAQPVAQTSVKPKPLLPNTQASQNYIPQNERQNELNSSAPSSSSNTLLNELLNLPLINSSRELQPAERTESNVNNNSETTNAEQSQENDFSILNSLVPESVSKAVSDLLLRPPPKLKPRPPGILSNVFDEGVPSSAGDVTAKINSVSHRLGDYFRGMLIETLEDLGKSSNPEAKITSLQLEIEALKHRHNTEISEMKKNICTILKDIQKSIIEDRDRNVDETRAVCEIETIKRVELAKSKQWCANCSKEAQFYCCWNTSYCDYPCQQKHWPQHMGKCTQNVEKANNTPSASNRSAGQQLILRPTVPPKPGMGRVVATPTKVYMNRMGPPKTFKTLTTAGNHLTVIETTPGNYEVLGNGPIAVTGKILGTTSNIFYSNFKTNNVTVTSPSTSVNLNQKNVQKNSVSELTKVVAPALAPRTAVTLPVSAVLNENSE